jgi:hypothetical protein
MNWLMWKWFAITAILTTICLTGASSGFYANAQVTIIPGTEEEPSPEPEAPAPAPEPEAPAPAPEPASPETQSQTTSPGQQIISQQLEYAHFTPLTNSPGNQVKLIVNYTLDDSSFINKPMNAVMEVFSTNQSLVRISSFPQPIIANNSGSVTLATTFLDENISEVNVFTTFTQPDKVVSISNPVTASLTLGQVLEP